GTPPPRDRAPGRSSKAAPRSGARSAAPGRPTASSEEHPPERQRGERAAADGPAERREETEADARECGTQQHDADGEHEPERERDPRSDAARRPPARRRAEEAEAESPEAEQGEREVDDERHEERKFVHLRPAQRGDDDR